ncbi:MULTISPECIES: GNAT family N-acetyltransferase [Streptomyces]|uniref:GNAT family N-acetyltransferase n=1 Tax=Streptomyces californicus TaxID=67351 RepID=A0ABD7D512_9ACTN|nr:MULTISPECIES: GNAT family N-acetyltransferase [Streptomyces]NEA08126.1 GNAT family N-acetyltransferase [Streptomyces sp. SID10692]KOG81822.1 acetyltransferase [Streptomyces griseus subsp. rhodochrous]KOU49220.1 acetyltransferase [Streptomyces sp. MMG1522]MBD3548518.1 GNAT family N-acetyltransferase [Streptomyces sp. JV180]QRV32244.1 GNAT family N-acetyltransferase [Streptomyces californicus]
MGVRIERAERHDRERVVAVMEEAFHHDPVSSWVFPDEAHRRAVHGRFLGVFVDVALAEGRIDIAEDGAAVALWLPVPAGAPEEEDPTPALMRRTADPDNERCELVGRLTGAAHPHDRAHSYLLMIGVTPDRQGEGIGAEMIRAELERCDREGLPAYLEASSARSRRLYERLGFHFLGRAVALPDGPPMYPMWREPKAS